MTTMRMLHGKIYNNKRRGAKLVFGAIVFGCATHYLAISTAHIVTSAYKRFKLTPSSANTPPSVWGPYCREVLLKSEEQGKNNDTSNNLQDCQWTLIAGDSNNRNAFQEWVNKEKSWLHRSNCGSIQLASRGPLQYEIASNGHRCQERWSDNEMILVIPPNVQKSTSRNTPTCHIVTSKFNIDQKHSLKRLREDIHNTSYCGSELTSPELPPGYKRPAMPDMIWFSTGMWNLVSENRTNCDSRFSYLVEALLDWKATPGIKRVVWQTLFPINFHNSITNDIIDWDYDCQKDLARQNGIEIADVYNLTKPYMPEAVSDYHLRDRTLLIRQYLDSCCGGWDAYARSN